MNIKELKEILLNLPEEYEVKVQYRDSGGDYYGITEEDFSGYVRYCNERHLDWRGMLKAGIAEDATGKGVY